MSTTVPAVSPDGKSFDLPVESIAKAKALGWDVEDPNESLGSKVETGAIGLAHGAVPFAPDIIQGLGGATKERQKELAAANPTSYGLGKFAGSAAQLAGLAAATGGLGDLAEGAGAVGKAAEGASEVLPGAEAATDVLNGARATDAAAAAGSSPGAVADAIDASVIKGPTSLAEARGVGAARSGVLSSGYTQQAAAGAGSNASNYVNEAELGDHDFNGEALVQDVGLGALLGVAGEGTINALRDTVAPAVISRAGKALESVKNKLGDVFYGASDAVNGLEKGTTRAAGEAIRAGAHMPTTSETEALAKGIDEVGEGLKDAGKAHEIGHRPSEARANLQDVPVADVRPHIDNLSATMDQASSQLGDLAEKNGYAGSRLKKLESIQADFEKAVSHDGADAADLHAATLDLKQRLGELAFQGKGIKTGEEALADDAVKRVWGTASDTLKDPAAFGEEQAGRNAALDVATRQKINSAKQVAKDFGIKEIDLDSGRNELSIKPSKLRAALNGDPLQNQEKLQHLTDYLDSSKRYLDELHTTAGNAGAVVPGGDDLHSLLESVTAQRQAASAYEPIAKLLKGTREQAPLGLGAGGAAPLAGIAAHGLGASIPGVGAVVGAAAALRSPVKAMQVFAKISNTAAAAKDTIGAGVRKLLSSGAGRAEVTGVVSRSLRGLTVQSVNGAASGDDFQKQAKHIGTLAADTQTQMDNLRGNTGRLGSVAPMTTMSTHGAASRAIQALNAALPRNPAPSVLASEDKDWKPSGSALSEWNDLHAAVLKPPVFLDQLRDGTASPKTWAALQQAYPKWCEQVQQSTVEHIQTHPKLSLDTGQKLAVSMVMGSPVSPTVAPAQTAFQQQVFAANPPPQPQAHHRQPTQHGMDHLDLGTRSAAGHQRSR